MTESIQLSLRKKGRFLYVSTGKGKAEIKLHPAICKIFGLPQKDVLSTDEWKELIRQNRYQLAMDTVMRLLSRRAHTCHELKIKLKQRGFNVEITDRVLSEINCAKILDDADFAETYADELGKKGMGIHKMRAEMARRGLSGEIIDNVLSKFSSDDDEFIRARKVLESKMASFKREKEPRKRREKMFRFLYARGFSSELISKITNLLQTQK